MNQLGFLPSEDLQASAGACMRVVLDSMTSWTVACPASVSLGLSWQEY